MANSKKRRRQERALERLEARAELDGLGLITRATTGRDVRSAQREQSSLLKSVRGISIPRGW